VSSTPCGQCGACRDIDAGRFVDLIEVDAASRTKIEDTRDLLDNVQYTPARGRYKVYLIDEVHMLSRHSFNALLKTLEEPPPHVKFLLATTDPQNLPVTVLSRCLQFNLKRLPVGDDPRAAAAGGGQRGARVRRPSIDLLARAADGSLRDALSLLDQAASHGGGRLDEAEVAAMLGTVDREHAVRLLEAVAAGDGPRILAEMATLDERVPNYDDVLGTLAALVQRAAVLQAAPDLDDDEDGLTARARPIANMATPEDLQLWYQMAVAGRRDLPLAPSPRAGCEMVLLRMLAFRFASPAGGLEAQAPARSRGAGTRPAAQAQRPGRAAPQARAAVEPPPAPAESTPARSDRRTNGRNDRPHGPERAPPASWPATAATSAATAAWSSWCSTRYTRSLPPARNRSACGPLSSCCSASRCACRSTSGRPPAETPAERERRAAASASSRREVAIEEDPLVRELQQVFDATVDRDSIRPAD
jgi:DNA polymerase III subunit gamma/tau